MTRRMRDTLHYKLMHSLLKAEVEADRTEQLEADASKQERKRKASEDFRRMG